MTAGSRGERPPRGRAARERERLFMLSLDLLCVADLDGYFKHLNPAWERTFGWTTEELLARPWLDFVHPDDRPATIAEAEKLAGGASVLLFENRYRCKDGSYRWVAWRVPAPEPGSTTLYAVARDVTEARDAGEEIRRLNRKLQGQVEQVGAANRELEAFSYSISHDLRAPLRHMDGFAGLLAKHAKDSLDEKGRRYLDTIAGAAKQMGRLIDDLLAFSRVGRVELRRARVAMGRLVGEVRRRLETEGRRIAWEIGELPVAEGDEALLRQVWANLLSNAVKYTGTREEAVIEVGARREDGLGIVYSVKDNGVGFDMRYAGKLFGVFQRLHGAGEFEGTGIGLALVQRIVERHGGTVRAEGRAGEGATFSFSLPVKETEA